MAAVMTPDEAKQGFGKQPGNNWEFDEEKEAELLEHLYDFVLRISSYDGPKSPEEVQILPAMTEILIRCLAP